MSGRPRCSTTISDDVLTLEEIRNEDTWLLNKLLLEIPDNNCVLRWCARRQLIKNTRTCDNCQEPCSFQKYSNGKDGYRWSCPICRTKKSVRENSFFSQSHLGIQQILILIFTWCCGDPQKRIARESGVHTKIVIDWCSSMRNECTEWLNNHYKGIGGTSDNGEPIIVEIGESKAFVQKYDQYHYREGHWIFGGIERESDKCFLVEVQDRKADTLKLCIKQNILPGTHIVSDGWAKYANIEKIDEGNYQHSIVVRSVNSNKSISTHNVENLLVRSKKMLKRKFRTDQNLFEPYLHEFMYREHYKGDDLFKTFIITLIENRTCYF